MAQPLTENLIANIVLTDEVSEELLVYTGLVDNLRALILDSGIIPCGNEVLTYGGIPECATKFDCLQKDWLGFLEAQVGAQAEAQTHCTETRYWDLDVAEGNCLDHFDC
jgi:hypothetical protein